MNYIKGDIIASLEKGDIDVLVHQTNCKKIMGGGIAKVIASKYQEVEKKDKETNNQFGDIMSIEIEEGKYIVNAYAQYYPGSPNNYEFNYKKNILIDNFNNRQIALKICFKKIQKEFQGKKIGMPLIASGIAKHDKTLNDKDYFEKYIVPLISVVFTEEELNNIYIYIL